jgi:uncharacterized protein YjgD (DUF1641 family)
MKNHENQLMDILDLMEADGVLDAWLEEQAENAANERLYEMGAFGPW